MTRLDSEIDRLRAKGADARRAKVVDGRQFYEVHIPGFSNVQLLIATAIAFVLGFCVAVGIGYGAVAPKIQTARIIEAAGPITMIELKNRLAVSAETAQIVGTLLQTTRPASSPYEDWLYLRGTKQSPLIDLGRVEVLRQFLTYLQKQEDKQELLDEILEAGMVLNHPESSSIVQALGQLNDYQRTVLQNGLSRIVADDDLLRALAVAIAKQDHPGVLAFLRKTYIEKGSYALEVANKLDVAKANQERVYIQCEVNDRELKKNGKKRKK